MLKQMTLLLCVFLMLASFLEGQENDFFDDLDKLNTSLFSKSGVWSNGAPFDCIWYPENVTFDSGVMTLILNEDAGGTFYKSGEYRTNSNYKYGYFETRMKASNIVGTVNSFFTYTGPSENNPWEEIDIEILGRDPSKMQVNYWTNGVGDHEVFIDLGFDASEDFHVYGFDWQPEYIKWYVDGNLVHTEDGSNGPLPCTASKIMVNFWPGTGVDNWLGAFDGQVPQMVYYDYISYRSGGFDAVLLGDVNTDKNIDIVDALLIAQYYVGFSPPRFNHGAANVDLDNIISIVDALLVAQYYVGLITEFKKS